MTAAPGMLVALPASSPVAARGRLHSSSTSLAQARSPWQPSTAAQVRVHFHGTGCAWGPATWTQVVPQATSSGARSDPPPQQGEAPPAAAMSCDPTSQPTRIHPARLMREIVQVPTVEGLLALWRDVEKDRGQQHEEGSMNKLHVAAALVRLAKLVQVQAHGGRQPLPSPSTAAGTAQCPPSPHADLLPGSSGSRTARLTRGPSDSAAAVGPAPPRRRRRWHAPLPLLADHHDHAQAVPVHSVNDHRHIQQARQHSAADALVPFLVAELSQHYVRHAPHYTEARQHANVCWALGVLRECAGLQPEPHLLDCMQQALLASDAELLLAAKPQELSNMALGLTKLQYWRSVPSDSGGALQLLGALLQACEGRMEQFKPQELSNLSWALARAGVALLGVPAVTQHWAPQPPNPREDGSGVGAAAWARRLRGVLSSALQLASRQPHAFKPQELCSLLWSAAHASSASAAHEHARSAASPAPQLCAAADARPLFKAAVPVLHQHARAYVLNGQDVSNSVWAYAKLGFGGWASQLLMAWAPPATHGAHVPDRAPQGEAQAAAPPRGPLHDCMPDELSNVLWACATCTRQQQQQSAWLPDAQFDAVGRLAAWALARLAAHAGAPHGGGVALTPAGVCGACWAAARLKLPDTHARLALLQLAGQQAHLMSSHEVANTLWSLCTLPGTTCLDARARHAIQLLLRAAWRTCLSRPPAAPAPPGAAAEVPEGSAPRPQVLAQLSCAAGWAACACAPVCGWEADTSHQGGEPYPSLAAAGSARGSQQGPPVPHWWDGAGGGQPLELAASGLSPQPKELPPELSTAPTTMTLHPPDPALDAVPGAAAGAAVAVTAAAAAAAPSAAQPHMAPSPWPHNEADEARVLLPGWFCTHWQPLLAACVQLALPQLPRFSAHDLNGLAQGLSRTQPFLARAGTLDCQPLFARVAAAAAVHAHAGTIGGTALADLAAACVRARAPQRGLALMAARAVAARPAAYTPQVLANVLWALTSSRVQDPLLLERVSQALLNDPRLQPTSAPAGAKGGAPPAADAGGPARAGAEAGRATDAAGAADAGAEAALDSVGPELSLWSDAGSLLDHLGWQADTDEEDLFPRDDLPGGSQRWSARGQHPPAHPAAGASSWPAPGREQQWQQAVRALDDAHGSPGAAQQAARWAARVLRASPDGYAEPERSSAALAWTVLAWAFAKSSYHQHQLFDRLADAVLGGSLAALVPAQGPADEPGCHLPPTSTSWPSPPRSAPSGSISKEQVEGEEEVQEQEQAVASQCESASGQGPTSNTPSGAPAADGAAGVTPTGRQALAQLTTPCIVQLLWAFALHKHVHVALLHEASFVLAPRLLRGSLRPREVATVAWAYARLQRYEPLLFSAVLHEAQANVHRYDVRSWSKLAWAFSTLCLPAEEVFLQHLSRLQQRQRPHLPSSARVAPPPGVPASSATHASRREQRGASGSGAAGGARAGRLAQGPAQAAARDGGGTPSGHTSCHEQPGRPAAAVWRPPAPLALVATPPAAPASLAVQQVAVPVAADRAGTRETPARVVQHCGVAAVSLEPSQQHDEREHHFQDEANVGHALKYPQPPLLFHQVDQEHAHQRVHDHGCVHVLPQHGLGVVGLYGATTILHHQSFPGSEDHGEGGVAMAAVASGCNGTSVHAVTGPRVSCTPC